MDIHVVSNTIRLNHMASSHASCFNKQTWVGATQSRQTVCLIYLWILSPRVI